MDKKIGFRVLDKGKELSTKKMNKYIEEYLANNLEQSHIFQETNLLPVTKDGVPIRKLFVSNLAEKTTYKDLTKLFSKYGDVESCFLRRNHGKSNYAFITFNSVDAAVRARYAEAIKLHNRYLKVEPADSWHQPDNIENQCYSRKEETRFDKKASNESCDEDYMDYDITEASIQKLNDDCLTHIFLQLPIVDRVRIERVCKRWRALSLRSWRSVKRLDLSYSMWGLLPGIKHREIDNSSLRKVLLRCGPFLTDIDLSFVPSPLSPSTLTIVGKLCPNLQKIDVTGLNVSICGIDSLVNNCHSITKLCLGSTIHTCDTELQKLFKVNPKLKYFKLVCGKICGRCLLHLPLDTIEVLALEDCVFLQENILSQAIKKLQNLKSFTINRCFHISGDVIEAIGTYCTNLKILDLSDISLVILSNDVLHIAQLSNLEVLKIGRNTIITDEFLTNLASKCLQLVYIDIAACSHLTNIGVAAIVSLPRLEVLLMSYSEAIADMSFRETCNLKRLECCDCNITDKTIIELLDYAPRLELLDLTGCQGITNLTLEKAATVTVNRTNNMILKIYVGGTAVDLTAFDKVSPFLQVVNVYLPSNNTFCIPFLL